MIRLTILSNGTNIEDEVITDNVTYQEIAYTLLCLKKIEQQLIDTDFEPDYEIRE